MAKAILNGVEIDTEHSKECLEISRASTSIRRLRWVAFICLAILNLALAFQKIPNWLGAPRGICVIIRPIWDDGLTQEKVAEFSRSNMAWLYHSGLLNDSKYEAADFKDQDQYHDFSQTSDTVCYDIYLSKDLLTQKIMAHQNEPKTVAEMPMFLRRRFAISDDELIRALLDTKTDVVDMGEEILASLDGDDIVGIKLTYEWSAEYRPWVARFYDLTIRKFGFSFAKAVIMLEYLIFSLIILFSYAVSFGGFGLVRRVQIWFEENSSETADYGLNQQNYRMSDGDHKIKSGPFGYGTVEHRDDMGDDDDSEYDVSREGDDDDDEYFD